MRQLEAGAGMVSVQTAPDNSWSRDHRERSEPELSINTTGVVSGPESHQAAGWIELSLGWVPGPVVLN